ncbi:hypothetical protein CI109_103644 [Kwoniella shandongensis]|uniref:Uncharacterized protein n=1 Tax=Kwoniella shandongensis TaxID=1734106 RepID=A0A5M6CBD2_9TREE|nr:uncharacterized protein CI109_000664 [Kwoniella shandongensis]KAA5531092.1 hypothetical protein CI109_000664 [Kwoniella shandongensis]
MSALSSTFLRAIAGPSRYIASPRTTLTTCRCLSTSTPSFSGHNRWSKIRHKKGAADTARGALFSKLSRDIITCMRPPASSDPALNSRLATALQRAKEGGLTKAGIENAMARARAAADGSGHTVVYDAVAPGGKVAMLVECLTPNPSRTVKRVKEILSKNGARTSPVAFLFERKGLITLAPNSPEANYEHLFEIAVEGGAEDVREIEGEDGSPELEVYTPPSQLSILTSLLTSESHSEHYTLQSSELAYVANDPLAVLAEGEEGEGVSEETVMGVLRIVDLLEEEGDVVKVWTNLADE